jgi:hypothetical protein
MCCCTLGLSRLERVCSLGRGSTIVTVWQLLQICLLGAILTESSCAGKVVFDAASCCPLSVESEILKSLHFGHAYCHGLFVLCGDTSIQLPRSGLYLRCEISFSISSVMPSKLFQNSASKDARFWDSIVITSSSSYESL